MLNQFAGWAILGKILSPFLLHDYNHTFVANIVSSVLLPALTPAQTHTPNSKLQQYFLAFGPLFVLLSISTEGLFYASFSLTLYLWVEVEARLYAFAEKPMQRRAVVSVKRDRGWRAEALSKSMGEEPTKKTVVEDVNPDRPRGLIGSDVRRAVFFLFFVQVAFFGAAKCVLTYYYDWLTIDLIFLQCCFCLVSLFSVALLTKSETSSRSFYLEPVYRLIPVFNPFFMASLLIFKIVAPYVVLSTVFATLNSRVGLPPFALFKVALGLTDGQ